MSNRKDKGLHDCYEVRKLNGKPLGRCIVLEFDDKIARRAIKAWSYYMREEGYELVANDIVEILKEYDHYD